MRYRPGGNSGLSEISDEFNDERSTIAVSSQTSGVAENRIFLRRFEFIRTVFRPVARDVKMERQSRHTIVILGV